MDIVKNFVKDINEYYKSTEIGYNETVSYTFMNNLINSIYNSGRYNLVDINAISIKANKNIHIKKDIPRATSLDFTNEEIKNAIPKNADERANNNPEYKKNISQGTEAPMIEP